MTEAENRKKTPPGESPATLPKVIDTRELFQGTREICIEHAGVRYRLRITQRNKLILQK